MKTLNQFEARLTWAGLTDHQRTPLEPIRQGLIEVGTAVFAMPDSPHRQDTLLGAISTWNYAVTCAQQPYPATATAGAA